MSRLEADYNEVMTAVSKMPKEAAERLLKNLAHHKEAMRELDSGLGEMMIGEMEKKALYYATKALTGNPSGENMICCPQCNTRVIDVNSIYYQAYESTIAAVADFVRTWYKKNQNIKDTAAKITGGKKI